MPAGGLSQKDEDESAEEEGKSMEKNLFMVKPGESIRLADAHRSICSIWRVQRREEKGSVISDSSESMEKPNENIGLWGQNHDPSPTPHTLPPPSR